MQDTRGGNWRLFVTNCVSSSRAVALAGVSTWRNSRAGMRGTVPGRAAAKCSVTESRSGLSGGGAAVTILVTARLTRVTRLRSILLWLGGGEGRGGHIATMMDLTGSGADCSNVIQFVMLTLWLTSGNWEIPEYHCVVLHAPVLYTTTVHWLTTTTTSHQAIFYLVWSG